MQTDLLTPAGRIDDAQTALDFLFSGKAFFTLVSRKTGTRYTYMLRRKDGGDLFFAHTLTGPNNSDDYTYLGSYWPYDGRGLKAGRNGNASDVRFKGLAYLLRKIKAGEMPHDAELWHEGRCGRCSRRLTDPASIARGLGPTCAGLSS